MDLNEKSSACDVNQLVSRIKEDLRVCREALLEAKSRIIVLEQRLRVFLASLIVLISITMVYAVIQIWQTATWLQDFGHYVRQERDPRLDKWMTDMRHDQDIIKGYIEKMQVK